MRRGAALGAVLAVLAACGGGGGDKDVDGSTTFYPDADYSIDASGPDAANETTVTDPQDLPGPDGDPALDIRDVTVGWDATGSPFVELLMDGAWPPSDAWYSWYVLVHLFGPGSVTFTIEAILQRHNGTRSTIVNGVPSTSVAVSETATGLRFTFASMPAVGGFRCEAGIQKTNPGTRVTDVVEGAGGTQLPFPPR
jgi:hypothetical protein